jgi:serine/threonine protein kinase
LVSKKDSGKIFAMKTLKKSDIIEGDLVQHTLVEREIMLSMEAHPFIINLNFAFQTDEELFFVLDYVGGGNMLDVLNEFDDYHLTESQARFYAAEILLALEALHHHHIIYRDLKLENILVHADGHIVITDFGLSAILKNRHDRVRSFSGTAVYIAPEVLKDEEQKGHGISVDWWAYGVLLHVLLTGGPPFWSENNKELFDQILNAEINLDDYRLSSHAKSLLLGLLERNVNARLDGPAVKAHPFFQGVDWQAMYNKEYTPPLIPKFDVAEKVKNQFDPNDTLLIGKKNREDRRFKGFSFVSRQYVRPGANSPHSDDRAWKSSNPNAKPKTSLSPLIRLGGKKKGSGINDSSIVEGKRDSKIALETHLRNRPTLAELEPSVFALSDEGKYIEEEMKKKKRKGFFIGKK